MATKQMVTPVKFRFQNTLRKPVTSYGLEQTIEIYGPVSDKDCEHIGSWTEVVADRPFTTVSVYRYEEYVILALRHERTDIGVDVYGFSKITGPKVQAVDGHIVETALTIPSMALEWIWRVQAPADVLKRVEELAKKRASKFRFGRDIDEDSE